MLSSELNNKILRLAPRFEAKDVAPSSFAELKSNQGRLVVWNGASEHTIYGDAAVNWAFRAWHDSLHLKLNAPFNLDGETLVCLEQCRRLGGQYGDIVYAEVVGQVEYLNKYGDFPVNQTEFIVNYLKGIL